MSEDLAKKLVTLNNKNKRSDNFYLTFYGIPESMGNILGRQSKAISRPNLMFQTTDKRHKGYTYKDKQNVVFDNVTLSFFDDEDSITSMIIYAQVMRQLNRHTDMFGNMDAVEERVYKFDLKVEFYNTAQEITEAYVLKNCFIASVQHSEHSLDAEDEKIITVVLEYDNLDVVSFDKLKALL